MWSKGLLQEVDMGQGFAAGGRCGVNGLLQ